MNLPYIECVRIKASLKLHNLQVGQVQSNSSRNLPSHFNLAAVNQLKRFRQDHLVELVTLVQNYPRAQSNHFYVLNEVIYNLTLSPGVKVAAATSWQQRVRAYVNCLQTTTTKTICTPFRVSPWSFVPFDSASRNGGAKLQCREFSLKQSHVVPSMNGL